MARTRDYLKNIACLESLWNDDVQDHLTMLPILDVVSKTYEIQTSYLTCNTEAELEFNLGLLARQKKYSVLYLAFHGAIGEIELADGTSVDLTRLAEMMGRKFKNWIVHFGSCSTAGADADTLEEFVDSTGITAAMGYTEAIDWIESAAMDMILLSSLQEYVDLAAMRKKIDRDYGCLVERLGFVSYP